jgi:hypothetical protein
MANSTERRYFVNNAPQTTITATITSGATTCVVASLVGWPSQTPFMAVFEANTGNEEIVEVTAIASSTLTITRGQDGTASLSHLSGATLDHGIVRRDIDEANAHSSASAGVHGVGGSVVGTTDTQNLTNKTLTSPTISSPTVTGTATVAAQHVTGNLQVDGNETVGGTLAVTGQATASSKVAPNEICQITNPSAMPLGGAGATWVANLGLTAPDFNTLGCAPDSGSSFTAVVIPAGKGGRYRISGSVTVDINSGRCAAGASKNSNGNYLVASIIPVSSSGSTTIVFGPKDVTLAAGDAIRLIVSPSSSANYNVSTGVSGGDTFLRVERVA